MCVSVCVSVCLQPRRDDDSSEDPARRRINAEDAAKVIQSHWRKTGGQRSRTRNLNAESEALRLLRLMRSRTPGIFGESKGG